MTRLPPAEARDLAEKLKALGHDIISKLDEAAHAVREAEGTLGRLLALREVGTEVDGNELQRARDAAGEARQRRAELLMAQASLAGLESEMWAQAARDRADSATARVPHVKAYDAAMEAFAADVKARKLDRHQQFARGSEVRELAVKAHRLPHFKREIAKRYVSSNELLRRLI